MGIAGRAWGWDGGFTRVEVSGFVGSEGGAEKLGGGTGGGGICTELDGFRSRRLEFVGDTARGAVVDPEVDGRDAELWGERERAVPVAVLGGAATAKGDTGERVCGEGEVFGRSWF